MPTVETKIWQALCTRVASLPLGLTIDWPLMPFDKPQSGGKPLPYIECRHIPNRVNRLLIGSQAPQERPGIVQLTLCWPVSGIGAGSGKTHPDVLTQRAGEIAAHFPTDLRLTFDEVVARIERAPDVAQAYRDDAYVRVPVSVRYRCFA